jgi:ABC-type sugar transport system permease subunit
MAASVDTVKTRPSFWQRLKNPFSGRDGAKRLFLLVTITPMVLYMAYFTLLPVIWAVGLTMFEYSARREGGPILGFGGENPFVGLQHFSNMFNFSPDATLEVQQFHQSLKTTLMFAFIILPLNLAITLPLAVLIESIYQQHKTFFRTIFFLPIVTSAVGVAIIWGFILHPQRGLVNGLITLLTGKLTAIGWTTDASLTFAGIPVALISVIVAYLWQDFGYNFIIFVAALQAIPKHIKDAAEVDGINAWQMFWKITLPLLRPTILVVCVLTMISSFQVFDIIQVMTDGGPDDLTRVMVLDIYNNAFRFQRMGWAAAVSAVLFLIVFVISVLQTRVLRTDWEY